MNDREIRQKLEEEMESVTASPRLIAQTRSAFAQKTGRMRLRVAVSLAAAVLILAVSAFAAGKMGLLDFLGGRSVPTDAEESVVRNVASARSDGVTATIREAVVSGDAVYLLVDIAPMRGALLLPWDAEWSDPVQNLTGADGDGTIGDSFRAGEYASAWRVSFSCPGENQSHGVVLSMDGRFAGGVYTAYVLCQTPDPGMELELSAILSPADGEDASRIEISLSFSLPPASVGETASCSASLPVPECGVQVTGVTFTRLAMETQVVVTFVVREAKLYAATDGGLWFRVLDESGSLLPDGVRGIGSVELLSGQDGSEGAVYRETISVFTTEMPRSVILEAYNCWEKNVYGRVCVPLA